MLFNLRFKFYRLILRKLPSTGFHKCPRTILPAPVFLTAVKRKLMVVWLNGGRGGEKTLSAQTIIKTTP